MKLLCALLLMLASFVTPHQDAADSPTGGYTLEITANRQQDHFLQWDFTNHSAVETSGAVVEIAVRKTNTSRQEILKFPIPYHWAVRNAGGDELAPRRAESRDGWIRGGGPGFVRGTKDMFLEPGESLVSSYRLSGYDMSEPGTYTVQVSQHISNDPGSPVVQSNTISITVLAKDKIQP